MRCWRVAGIGTSLQARGVVILGAFTLQPNLVLSSISRLLGVAGFWFVGVDELIAEAVVRVVGGQGI